MVALTQRTDTIDSSVTANSADAPNSSALRTVRQDNPRSPSPFPPLRITSMTQLFTEGARRALQFAMCFAHQRDSDVVEPEHLLAGLIVDEAHASTILAQFAVSVSQLEERLPGLRQLAVAVQGGQCGAPVTPHSALTEFVIQDATALARRETDSGEVGSEHILWSLVRIETDVTALLAEHGLTTETLEQFLHHETHDRNAWASPIEPDEALAALRSELDALESPTESEPTLSYPTAADRLTAAANADSALWRVLDAAANRAREGLRVLEDYARFFCDDVAWTTELKQMRHAISRQLPWSGQGDLLRHRDTPGDVGTQITTATETHRATVREVLQANCKRVQEAVRTLEEFGKLLDASAAAMLEQIRYRLYALEQHLLADAAVAPARAALHDCRLYLLLTRDQCDWPVLDLLPELVAAGVDVVQIREKTMTERELLEWSRSVRDVLEPTRCRLVMNDRPDLASLVPCHGVHLGQDEIPAPAARTLLTSDMFLGVSTHDPEQARQAIRDGADYLGVGPVFPSDTKHFSEFVGTALLREVTESIAASQIPAFAIGGIQLENLAQVLDVGCRRVAVSGAICRASDPVAAAAAFAEDLRADGSRAE